MFVSVRRAAFWVVMSVMLAATAACTTGPARKPSGTVPSSAVESTSQPRVATYNCADGGMITVENLGSSVKITGADEEPIELPASPAAQTSRYGEQPYAMVLDGRDALFMKSGQEPLTCTR